MEKLRKTADELSELLFSKGFERFNIKHVCVGENFKTAIESYIYYANNVLKTRNAFPLEMVAVLPSKTVGDPQYVARLRIFEDANQGLRIGTMEMGLYHEGMSKPLTSISVSIKFPEHIPHGERFKKIIDEKWQKEVEEKRKNWHKPKLTGNSTGKRMKR